MKKTVLFIGYVWPEPSSSAAGRRMLDLISLFCSDYDVVFASSAEVTDHSHALSELGVRCESIALNDDGFDDFVKALAPTVVIFDRFVTEEQFGWRVSEVCPHALRILDTEDLHFLRKAREKKADINGQVSFESLQTPDAIREIAAIYRSDLSLMISSYECQLLEDAFQLPKALLHYLPFMVDSDSIAIDEVDDNDRQDFLFIGNFKHKPNLDAVIWLKESIWPQIRQALPEAKIRICGAYANDKVFAFDNKHEGFHVIGRVDDALKTIQSARVLLAPLRFGAGLKGKLLEALMVGTPFVTTPIGIEGYPTNDGNEFFVADNENDFAKKAIRLFQNQAMYQRLQQQGFHLLKTAFDKKQFSVAFHQLLSKRLASINAYRQQNFIGTMLRHQSFQSTRYLSKWIAAKNQLKALTEGQAKSAEKA